MQCLGCVAVVGVLGGAHVHFCFSGTRHIVLHEYGRPSLIPSNRLIL